MMKDIGTINRCSNDECFRCDTAMRRISSEEKMRELGFTDHREGWWYACFRLADRVTLNLSVEKATGAWTEDVLNEDFGQPEYYGLATPEFRDEIISKIDEIISNLGYKGLLFKVDHRQYGVKYGPV